MVYGRVQGVSFRYFVMHKAKELGLTGYTRNIDEDKVEVVAEGDESKLKELAAECRKGPALSRVLDMDINFQPYTGHYKDFTIRY
jgi:acylphosphatase